MNNPTLPNLQVDSLGDDSVYHFDIMRFVSRSSLITLLLLVVSCSNSPIFINPIYNRLDDQIMTSFERLTEFDEAQISEFDKIADNFHYWHRKSELPLYAALLADIQKSIRAGIRPNKGPTREDVAQWLQRSEAFTRSFRACHPVNFSNNIIRSLTDEQLQAIKEGRATRQAGYRQRYFDNSPEARLNRRYNNIVKWVSRIGLELNDRQKKRLRETLARQISLRKEYFALSADWNKRLYDILDERDSPELDARMAAHLDELWHLLERAHPEQWKANRELWTDFVLELVGSFSGEQRTYASGWIKKMGKTLLNVSRRSSAPQPSGDGPDSLYSAKFGCAEQILATSN